MTVEEENVILTNEVMRLSKELAEATETPDGQEEIGRIFIGEDDGGRHHVSVGLNEKVEFDSDESKIMLLGEVMFGIFNMVRSLKGDEPLVGRVSMNEADTAFHELTREKWGEFFKDSNR